MEVNFRKAFKKDLRKLKEKKLLTKIQQIIENVEIIAENTEKDESSHTRTCRWYNLRPIKSNSRNM